MQTELMSLDGATYILKKMRGCFGEKFDKQWSGLSSDEVTQNAREVLAGLTRNQVATGLRIMSSKVYCPALSEFRSWCLEGSSHFLDMETAYLNAANEKYTDAATYEAARRTGFFEIRSRAESSTKPSFKKHYEAVCAALAENPEAFRLPESKQIEQSPPQFVKKGADFFKQLRAHG